MTSPITSSSAIDVQGIVSSLVNAERRPLVKMQADAKQIDTKISAYGKLQSLVAKFRDVANTLSNATNWLPTQATSTQPALIGATAKAGAAPAQYNLTVEQLAGPQTVHSGGFASTSSTIGGGTLRIQLGQQPSGPGSFAPDPTRPEQSIAIPADATLAQIRDAINGANAGVRASFVRDGDQYRLLMSSSATGQNQAFRITVEDLDGQNTDTSGLSALAFDPTALSGQGRNLSLIKQAEDARYTVDGLALTAPSNRITDALEGVDLEFKQVTSTPVRIDVATNVEAMKTSAQSFVDAYNELNTLLAEQTRYNESSKSAGVLQGDSSAVGVLNRIRGIVKETLGTGTMSRLADAGIRLQKDGSLNLDEARFRDAAADPAALQTLMTQTGATNSERGLMRRVRDLGDQLLSSQGSLTTATNAWTSRKTSITKRQEAFENRLTTIQQRLLKQFSALDAQLVQSQQSSNALASALSGLSKNTTA